MSEPVYVIYDGECPFCRQYARLLRLRAALGPIRLVDARDADDPIVKLVEAAGIVLDDEMAMILDGEIYAGADCLNRLSLLTTDADAFNRLNALIFRNKSLSRALYPMLRGGRWLSLKLLGHEMMGR